VDDFVNVSILWFALAKAISSFVLTMSQFGEGGWQSLVLELGSR